MNSTLAPTDETINDAVQQAVADHFAEAHQLVPEFHRKHFLSARQVAGRHWRHKRDIPGDLLAVPKLVWQSLRRSPKECSNKQLSGKESAVLQAIESELLRPQQLQLRLTNAITACRADWQQDWQDCSERLQHPMNQKQRDAISQFLELKAIQLSGPREGSRDLLVFLIVGAIGHQITEKVTFGSALATGSALASSLYVSQQSWWYGLWLSWNGVPAWVSWTGAVGGFATALVLTPMLSPLAELVVNRLRGERFLHELLNEIETERFHQQTNILDAAGVAAGFSQLMPDLIALLKHLKV